MNAKQFLDWLSQYQQSPKQVAFKKPLIMGVVNVTPDSFSDGGAFLAKDKACAQVFNLIEQGADLIDIGGESTRPKAAKVPLEVELERVIPVIEEVRRVSDICISIDTYKPQVMQAAVTAGANCINDVYALQQEGALEMAASLSVPVCLMHMQGSPETMQVAPHYPLGVMVAIMQFFRERITACLAAGIDSGALIVDPGFGFGKRVVDNLLILNQWNVLKELNKPLLLGVSRKSTVGFILDKPVAQRVIGSIAMAVHAASGGVGILRTHDVDETRQAMQILEAVYNPQLYD